MNFTDKSYLITGAAGFIGSHLGNVLVSNNARVRGIDNYLHPVGAPPRFPVERADIREPEFILSRSKGVDAILHLAAAINIDAQNVSPELGLDYNVVGTFNVLEVARKLDLPMVFASSSEVYGSTQERACWCHGGCVDDGACGCPNQRSIDEGHPLDGQSPYAAFKIAGDRMCHAWKETYGMDINIVRSFNTYGPWQGDDAYGGVIAKFVSASLSRKPMTIFGTGEQRRDYLWIDDSVSAYLFALSTRFPGPVNFGTGTTVSINELAHLIGAETGFTQATHIAPRAGEVHVLRCDWSKAGELGWRPTVRFREGLSRYIEWARKVRTTST